MDTNGLLVNDYLDRVRVRLTGLPLAERNEFIRELDSHIRDAYRQTPGDDGPARMLQVLRNLGEPAELAAGRTPVAARETKLRLPIRVLGMLFGTIFGLPLTAALTGATAYLVAALTGILAGLFAASAGLLTAGSTLVILGLTRIYRPDLWELAATLSNIRLKTDVSEALAHLTEADQGLILLCLGLVLAALSVGVFKVAQQYFRVYRFALAKIWTAVRWVASRIGAFVRGVAHDLGLFGPRGVVYQP